MTVDVGPGGVVVPADSLVLLLSVIPAQVLCMIRDSEITSRREAGIGEDAGRHRLKF